MTIEQFEQSTVPPRRTRFPAIIGSLVMLLALGIGFLSTMAFSAPEPPLTIGPIQIEDVEVLSELGRLKVTISIDPSARLSRGNPRSQGGDCMISLNYTAKRPIFKVFSVDTVTNWIGGPGERGHQIRRDGELIECKSLRYVELSPDFRSIETPVEIGDQAGTLDVVFMRDGQRALSNTVRVRIE